MWGITEKIEEKTWQAIEGVTDEETYSEAKERAEVRRSDHVVVFIFVLGAVIAVYCIYPNIWMSAGCLLYGRDYISS